jgi:hypothetical protein
MTPPMFDRNGRAMRDGIAHIQRPAYATQSMGQCPACLGPAVHAPGEKACKEVQTVKRKGK